MEQFDGQESESRTEFAKELGLKEAVSIAVGAMIGGGIFSVLGRLAGMAGPAAVVSFFLGGVIAFLTANSYYRLISKYPSSGGEFTILRSGFKNPLVGNILGAMLWLGYSVTIALYAFTFGLYVSEFIHGSTGIHFFAVDNINFLSGRKLFAFLSIFTFMMINLKGVKESGTIQNVIVAFKLMVLLFVGVLGLYYFKGDRYTPFTLNVDPYEFFDTDLLGGFSGIVIGSAVIFVAYEGFDVIANTVEEMKNPARDVKLGMYISVITVTITYMVVTVATFSLVDDPHNIDEAALIQAVEFIGPWAILLITLGAVASTTSAINATLLGSSRLAYVMSDYQAFPKQLAVISKKSKVPYLAIIATSSISWLFTLFGNAEQIAEVGSIIFLGIFLVINYSILKIFPKEKNRIAKFAIVLIIIYMALVFVYFFTHLAESALALVVLAVFLTVSIGYMMLNEKYGPKKDLDTAKYVLEPLGKDLIKEFHGTGITTDDFFIDLENMLVPITGKKFETLNWKISAQIAMKYRVKVTLLLVSMHAGDPLPDISKVTNIFDNFAVDYKVKHVVDTDVSRAIINTYNLGDYQLVTLASRRRKTLLDRMFIKSISREVVDNVGSAVLQVHPPRYGVERVRISHLFMLLDGSERDYYLARWAKLMGSSAEKDPEIHAYHVVLIPQTISLEDAADFIEVKRSAREFDTYSNEISMMYALNSDSTLLYGHNFVKSLKHATQKHQPDAVLIGHTKDTGIWDRIRTRIAYRIMRELDSAVIIYHSAENENGNIRLD